MLAFSPSSSTFIIVLEPDSVIVFILPISSIVLPTSKPPRAETLFTKYAVSPTLHYIFIGLGNVKFNVAILTHCNYVI